MLFLKSLCKSVLGGIAIGGFAITLVSSAHANLINNGSFEIADPNHKVDGYGSASTWQIYTAIPDWQASQNIEIWSSGQVEGKTAYDGDYLLELNAHPGNAAGTFSISQDFNTAIGQEYLLTFAGHRRKPNQNETFNVSVGDLSTDILNQASGDWNQYSFVFTATDLISTLIFTSLDGGTDTTGNLLDDVKITAVPQSSTLALIMAGLIGLISVRRKS